MRGCRSTLNKAMSKNQEIQQKQEESAVWPLVRHFGLANENVIITDSPDVIFKDFEGKTIGVENVGYHSKRNISKTNNKLFKICREYKQILVQRGDTGFQMNIHFKDEVYLMKRLDEKSVLAEMDAFRFSGKRRGWQYIDDISCYGSFPKEFVEVMPIWYGFIEENLNHDLLREIVKKKEARLRYYKQLNKNDAIDEYWLNIHIPSSEFSIYGPKDEISIKSDYDRVYLTFWDPVDIPLRLK